MNPLLAQLHPYPFEKLSVLKEGISPPAAKSQIMLSIGEPKHITPKFIQDALIENLHGLAVYPSTKGLSELRESIANWISRRFTIPIDAIDTEKHILPVNGTREALFSFAQAMIDPTQKPIVVMPNPFYQIYEGACLLAGAEPYYLNTTEENDYLPDFDEVPAHIWERCQLVFICSPGNPTGRVFCKNLHNKLLELAERYDFIIASDECYTEIYDDEQQPPFGLLQSVYQAGNHDFKRCIIFHSLSKRSNTPGLRSGFVAGDANLLKQFLKYRTYHGCAMPLPTQYASMVAWQDEEHVIVNRILYREKFTAFIEILANNCQIIRPPASFYVWLKIPVVIESQAKNVTSDLFFAKQLFAEQNVTVLPGSYLSRESKGINPGAQHVRIALVAPLAECVDAAERIKQFINTFI